MSSEDIILIVPCVPMATCLVVQGAILIQKIHKLEDERL